MRRILCITWLVLVATATVGSVLVGQGTTGTHRHRIGLSFDAMLPTGDFDRHVDAGFGLTGSYVVGLDRGAVFGVRLEGSAYQYGSESYDIWLGPRMPDTYLSVTTSNSIVAGGVGPQVTVGTGPFLAYGFALVGMSYFVTHTSLNGPDDSWLDAHTNYDDLVPAASLGGGILIRVYSGRRAVWIDVAGSWTDNARTSYLVEGSTIEIGDEGIVVDPVRGDSNNWSLRIGVAVGM